MSKSTINLPGEEAQTRYYDAKGNRVVFVSRGTGDLFGAFFVTDLPEGGLCRLKAAALPMCESAEEAQRQLDRYAANHWGLFAVPDIEDTEALIMLILEDYPPQEEIEKWSERERGYAAYWACMAHLHASDNSRVRVPPVPEVVVQWSNRAR